jgi:hypothetical protein
MKDVHKEYDGRKRNRCLRMSTTMELACTLAETYSPQDNIAFAPVKINMDFIPSSKRQQLLPEDKALSFGNRHMGAATS